MPNFKKILPFILIVVLIFTAIVIYVAYRSKKNSSTSFQISNENSESSSGQSSSESSTGIGSIDSEAVEAAAKENFKTASDKALSWHADAVFVYSQVKLPDFTQDSGTETYVFDSPAAPTIHFVFTVSQKSKRFIRAEIPKEDYLGDLKAVPLNYWKISYLAALKIAEQNGGGDFRDSNLNWSIEINLKVDDPSSYLYWVVDYKTEGGNSLSVKINASSSEVVK